MWCGRVRVGGAGIWPVRLVSGLTVKGVFLRLRTGLRRIRWVAPFGEVPAVALAAGGCVGRLKVKTMVK